LTVGKNQTNPRSGTASGSGSAGNVRTSNEGQQSFVFEEEYVYWLVRSHIFSHSPQSLKINMKTENPATCKMRSVIKFLNAKNVHPAEIHRRIVKMDG
jgi:hypothetical protein